MKKKVSIIVLMITLIGSITFLLYHQKNLRCLFIQNNSNFYQIQDHVFVSKNTPQLVIDSLGNLIKQSKTELKAFWGNLISEPTIIFCYTQNEYYKFGKKNTAAICRLGKYIAFTMYGLKTDVISHELCHAELFSRIGENYFKYYTQLPCWFDEGIALQFDSRDIYNDKEYYSKLILDKTDLEQLDRPGDFYTNDHSETLKNYLLSKLEIERFILNNSAQDLVELVDKFKNGGDLYEEYFNLR